MKDNTNVFESYKVPKAVATMAIPSMVGMLINIIYNMADTFFVGQTGDSNQVAAVSVSMPMFLFFLAIGTLFGAGGCAYISRSLGEGNKDKVKQISSFAIYTSIGFGLLLGVVFFLFCVPIVKLAGASENTVAYASDYLKWIAIGSPFVVTAITVGNLVRGEGAAKVSMTGMVLGQIVNIILDPIFILEKGDKLFNLITLPVGFDMGVAGAAIATVIGNVFSVVYFLVYFLRGKSILSISSKRFAVKGIVGGVINVGLPAALNNLLMSISNIFINIVLSHYGDNAVAGMGVAMKANMLVVMLQIGLGAGVQPLIGYCYGAKNYKRMKSVILFSIICNVVIGSVMTLFYVVFKDNVIQMFIDDASVVDIGVKMLIALMSPGPIIGIMFVLNFAFQGMGKGIQSLILSVGRQGLVYFPVLFVMNKLVGLNGVIWAQPVADMACIIMAIIFMLSIMKKINIQEKISS